jgi:hypothetical protein
VWDLWWTKLHWYRTFSPSTSILPCQFRSIGVPLHGKTEKVTIFVTGLQKKPEGCGASVASAAGPWLFKKKLISDGNMISDLRSLIYGRFSRKELGVYNKGWGVLEGK